MIQFLIRHFVPDHEQTQQPQVRQRYGVLAAVVGILSNIFLFLIKVRWSDLAVPQHLHHCRCGQQPFRRRLLGDYSAGL